MASAKENTSRDTPHSRQTAQLSKADAAYGNDDSTGKFIPPRDSGSVTISSCRSEISASPDHVAHDGQYAALQERERIECLRRDFATHRVSTDRIVQERRSENTRCLCPASFQRARRSSLEHGLELMCGLHKRR